MISVQQSKKMNGFTEEKQKQAQSVCILVLVTIKDPKLVHC
jgi:hypothetical protein